MNLPRLDDARQQGAVAPRRQRSDPRTRGFSARRNAARTSPARGAAIRPGLESSPGLEPQKEKTMARKDPGPKADRRRFLAGFVAAGAATAMTPPVARAAETAPAPRAPAPAAFRSRPGRPASKAAARTARVKGIPGSDFMVDVIKT